MGKKISAAAMLVAALTIMFLVPAGLGKLETQKDNSDSSYVQTEQSVITTTAAPINTEPDKTTVMTGESTAGTKPETVITAPTSEEKATEKTSETKKTETKKPATVSQKTEAPKTTTTKKPTTTTKKVTTTKKATTTTKKVTTTKKPAAQKPSPSGTPVSQHGQLSVKGANIVDKNGKVFQLRGMSTHGIMWEDFSDILSKESLKVLRDDWGCNTIRIAMYTEEYGGYTTGADFARQAKEKVNTGVANATDLGMYVIIDWHVLHDQNPQNHQSEAIAFFTEMSKKYADYNNVLYEICNEPNGSASWDGNIKPYAEQVIPVIRKYDKDAIIICGTPTWSQDIDRADSNRLADKNTVYALHFYANTHTDWLRNRLQQCYNNGLPILVSEFGTCDASGNGGFNAGQTDKWFELLDKLNVGYLNWSACGKSETASAFTSGTDLKNIKAGTGQLTESGKLIRSHMRKRAGLS